MIRVLGPKEIRTLSEEDKKKVINTTSTSKTWSRGLSPFILGPAKLYRGNISLNMENGYQYSKVYPEHVGAMNLPAEDYWDWAKDGWAKKEGIRYPMGKGRKPLYTYWDGAKLGYIAARREVYIPLYRNTVIKSDAFSRLEREYHNRDKDIILFDFDAYDHRALGFEWNDVINCEERKAGHGFVLAMLLENYLD